MVEKDDEPGDVSMTMPYMGFLLAEIGVWVDLLLYVLSIPGLRMEY